MPGHQSCPSCGASTPGDGKTCGSCGKVCDFLFLPRYCSYSLFTCSLFHLHSTTFSSFRLSFLSPVLVPTPTTTDTASECACVESLQNHTCGVVSSCLSRSPVPFHHVPLSFFQYCPFEMKTRRRKEKALRFNLANQEPARGFHRPHAVAIYFQTCPAK